MIKQQVQGCGMMVSSASRTLYASPGRGMWLLHKPHQHSSATFFNSSSSIQSSTSTCCGHPLLKPWRMCPGTGRNPESLFLVPCAFVHHHKERTNMLRFLGIIRANTRKANKHFLPEFSKLRAQKFIKPELPDMDLARKKETEMSLEEIRAALKKEGIPPGSRPYNERPLLVSSTAEVHEPYPVPEGEGKRSFPTSLSGAGTASKDAVLNVTKKALMKDVRARRKIKAKLGEDFDHKEFPDQALRIYIDAHTALQDRDSHKLHDLVTEKAYPEMWKEVKLRSFRWKFVENVEPPRIVRVRVCAQVSKDNEYGQITVRIHSKQTLAVYDQFGRLMLGSENIQVPVIEYVVFENHIVNQYGTWRLHSKLQPDRRKPNALLNTFIMKELKEKFDVPDQVDKLIDTDTVEEDTAKPPTSPP